MTKETLDHMQFAVILARRADTSREERTRRAATMVAEAVRGGGK